MNDNKRTDTAILIDRAEDIIKTIQEQEKQGEMSLEIRGDWSAVKSLKVIILK